MEQHKCRIGSVASVSALVPILMFLLFAFSFDVVAANPYDTCNRYVDKQFRDCVAKIRSKHGVVTEIIGAYPGECVAFARSRVALPKKDLTSYEAKKSIANSHTPKVGSAVITNDGQPYGHIAVVESVGPHSITIVEANYKKGKITRRIATGSSVLHAQQLLKITGYYP